MMKVIITGATGMVGEGVMMECLASPLVSQVLLVNRRPSGFIHAKLSEALAPDFTRLDAVTAERFAEYDACFFCAGVSSVGKKEDEYTRITYDLTLAFAHTLLDANPGMTFIYVSGSGTDSSEKGRSMWARVKGRTENAIIRMGFARAYAFRPGFMRSTPGQKNVPGFYRFIGPLYRPLALFVPSQVSTLSQVGRAMIRVANEGYSKAVLEVPDINSLAQP